MDPSNSYPQPPLSAQDASDGTRDDRLWATFAHLSAFLGLLIPLANIFAPLVLWLVLKETKPFSADQAKDALNFNIATTIYTMILVGITFVTFGLGAVVTLPLLFAIFLAWLILTIIAAVKANGGEYYRYPMTLRLVT